VRGLREAGPPMMRGKVYLVEDDRSVRKALHRLIESAGFEVESFADAAGYMGCPVPSPPACIVLDVRMPIVSGFELQSAISGTDRALPIVFITGHGGEDSRAKALESGAVALLFKPLDEDALLSAIDRALGETRRSGSGEGPRPVSGRRPLGR
jgi:FixJ family two-component response regulator